jgi:hypothetical protein
MYSLIRGEDVSGRLVREVPALGSSLLVAETFYKFHSFSLECVAFLGTWFAASLLIHALFPRKKVKPAAADRRTNERLGR